MLQILKKEGNEGYEELLGKLGLLNAQNIKISEAVDGEKVGGFGIYSLSSEQLTVYKISYGGDLMLGDGLIRSILFLAALKGVEKAVFENGSDELPRKLCMIKEGNVLEPVSEVFGGCENCKDRS